MKGSVRRELFFDTAESEALGMCGNSMRENRETLQTPTLNGSVGRSKKAKGRNVDMHVCGESDGLIVPTKRANKVDAYALAGVRRGKEADQGERTTSLLAPDTEPGMQVTGVVARTTSTSGWSTDEPEVRAV